MVQISDHEYEQGSKDWWKVDSGKYYGAKDLLQILKDNIYSHKSKSKRVAHLRALYVRWQRGLMSYEGLSIRELKLYAAQRQLPAHLNKKVTLTELKSQLEQADEDVTFRLSDLPPELRNIIFSYYFDSVVEFRSVFLRRQPPITYASRIIRRETLPLFFERFGFTFDYSLYANRHAADPERYMSRTTAHSFALMRHFIIRARSDAELTVDFANNNNFSFKLTPPWNKCGEDHAGIRDHISAAVDSLLQEIVTRGEAWNLRTADIEALRNILGCFNKPLQEQSAIVPTQSVSTYDRPVRERSTLLWDLGRSRRAP